MKRSMWKGLVFIHIIVWPSLSTGQKNPTSVFDKEWPSHEEIKQGWHSTLEVGTNISLGLSENWIGQTDGGSTTVGLSFDGSLNYQSGPNEWRNTLNIFEASTKNPHLPHYVKSSDEVTIKSIYLRSLDKDKWLHLYVRFKARTSLFEGKDIRSENYVYQVKDSRGLIVSSQTRNAFRLTDGLRPMNLKESIGLFANPYKTEECVVEYRLGMGVTQVIADHQFRIDSVNLANKTIKVAPLKSYDQVGVEFGLSVRGQIDDKSSYELGYETLLPFTQTDFGGDKKGDIFRRATHEAFIKLSTKFYKSISLNGEYRLRKQPLLLDQTQAQGLALVRFTYTLF